MDGVTLGVEVRVKGKEVAIGEIVSETVAQSEKVGVKVNDMVLQEVGVAWLEEGSAENEYVAQPLDDGLEE